jgi:hypothetical protein
MKLYLIHCGFYDPEVCDGIYEGHVNLFVVAESFEQAKRQVRLDPAFKLRRMHVDGVQQVDAVHGHRITATPDPSLEGRAVLTRERHRDF